MGFLLGACANPSRHVGGVKPFGEADKAISASSTARMRALLRSMPPTMVLPTCEAVGRCSSSSSAMKALIDATESIGKPFQHAFQSPHHLGELLQRATAVELARVMSNRLDAKDAFAFGIDLQSQLAAVQLEDRQIIRRSLDRDFPFG